jgi:hypothetical protein
MSDRRALILARSDAYEGFDRPALEDPRAQELAAAFDIPALRRRLTDLAREGVDDYDLIGLGQIGGAFWEFIGFDVADRQGRSAIRHRSGSQFEDRISQHGLFWNHADAQAFLEATGAAELVPIMRFRRSGLRPGQALWYTIGNEFNPSDPFGRIVLTVDADDHAVLHHHWMQGNGAWAGDVATGLVARIKADLARGGFPAVPQHQLPGGATLRQVEVVDGDADPQYAVLYERLGMELDGYREAFEALDALAVQLSGGRFKGAHDTLPPSVSDVRVLPS